jgi:hypothetical protein
MFFFEKKNQKTFDDAVADYPATGPQILKVFCFFFSKKKRLLTIRRRNRPRRLSANGIKRALDGLQQI